MKRIALLQLARTLTSTNGMTTFVDNFIRMNEKLGVHVDLITDRDVNSMSKPCVLDKDYTNVSYFYPDEPLSATIDTRLRGTFTYSVALETQINFRDALYKAMTHNVYDMILLNSEDPIPAVINMDLRMPVYMYTHFAALVWPDQTQPIFKNLVEQTECYQHHLRFLTQSQKNVDALKERNIVSEVARLPLHPRFIENASKPVNPDADGMLFNGRIANEKRFDEFLRAAAAIDVPAYAMTGAQNIDRMVKMAKEAGVKNFTVVSGVTGEEKIQFMRQAKVTYHPSIFESFGYAVGEACHVHSVVVDGKYPYTHAFSEQGLPVTITETKNIDAELKRLVEEPISIDLNACNRFNNEIEAEWVNLYARIDAENGETKSNSKKLMPMFEDGSISVDQYFAELGRSPAYSDLTSLHKQVRANHVQTKAFENTTLLSLDGDFSNAIIKTREDKGLDL